MKLKIKLLASVAFLVTALLFPSALRSYESEVPPCFVQIQTNFFRQDLVLQVLGSYKVSQGVWLSIYRDLQHTSWNVPNILQAKAAALNPNPLSPFNRARAYALLRQSLFDVFFAVLINYRNKGGLFVINADMIRTGFERIWMQQQAMIIRCLQ